MAHHTSLSRPGRGGKGQRRGTAPWAMDLNIAAMVDPASAPWVALPTCLLPYDLRESSNTEVTTPHRGKTIPNQDESSHNAVTHVWITMNAIGPFGVGVVMLFYHCHLPKSHYSPSHVSQAYRAMPCPYRGHNRTGKRLS